MLEAWMELNMELVQLSLDLADKLLLITQCACVDGLDVLNINLD